MNGTQAMMRMLPRRATLTDLKGCQQRTVWMRATDLHDVICGADEALSIADDSTPIM